MAAAILRSSIAFIDGSIVSAALPPIRERRGASLTEMQRVVDGYALMLAAFILPAGSADDVLGRKRAFLIGVAVWTLAGLWCGLARSAPELIVARIFEGLGGAFMIPASLRSSPSTWPGFAAARRSASGRRPARPRPRLERFSAARARLFLACLGLCGIVYGLTLAADGLSAIELGLYAIGAAVLTGVL